MLLLAASQQSELRLLFGGLVAGVVIGVFGHITKLRWMILLGIVLIGTASVVFSFVLRPT